MMEHRLLIEPQGQQPQRQDMTHKGRGTRVKINSPQQNEGNQVRPTGWCMMVRDQCI